MKLSIVKGATSQLVEIFIQDSSKTTGEGLTGLAYNTASLVCYRGRSDDGNAGGTAISLATATLGTWTSGGFKEKDATNMPGIYEFGIPNAALASGSRFCVIMLKGATNMSPCPIEIELTGWDNQDAVRGGLTALPNANASASGGLLTDGTSTGQLNPSSGNVTVGTNNDKTGYSLTQTFPTNFSAMSISASTGLVDITQTAADKVWSTTTRRLSDGTNIVLAKGTGVTGFNDIAATAIVSGGAITTSAGAISNVTTVGSLTANNDKTGYSLATTPPTASENATAVWGNAARTLTAFGFTVSTNANATETSIYDLLNADMYVDKSGTPWQLVYIKRGTGGLGVGTELLRKSLKDVDGSNLASTETVVGQVIG